MLFPGPVELVGKAGFPKQDRSQRLALLTCPDRWANGRHQAGECSGGSGPSEALEQLLESGPRMPGTHSGLTWPREAHVLQGTQLPNMRHVGWLGV